MYGPFKWVTFDCYGTLIDWEEGILKALSPYLKDVSPAEVLRLYARFESEAEKTWRPYREVLKMVARKLFTHFGLKPREEVFLENLPHWRPFPEVNQALKLIKEKGLKTAIISNIDRDLLAQTLRHFTVSFDLLVTAEEARAYKPHPEIFALAKRQLRCAPQEVLHVGQSLFHDIVPARREGWVTCWVRRPGRDPFGATPQATGKPHFSVSSLFELLNFL